MTDITELAQSLKALANNAGADCWQAKKISGDFYVIRKGSYKRECGYTTYQPIAEIDHKPTRDYVALANPANVLALVEALEKAQQRIGELESKLANPVQLPKTNGYWTEQEKAYEEAITLAKRQVRLAGFRCEGDE
ncbi:TPA: ead/Ea22-like family protein [Klebsiella pneumoniae]|nr:ead/Ea22-like family protein [Klebsiella pneumoniae]